MQKNQTLNPQLVEIKRQIDETSQKAIEISDGVSFEKLKQRPQPGQWSIAECLVHLNLASQADIALLHETFGKFSGNRTPVEKPFKMELLSRFFKWTLEPPPISLFKIKTTQQFQPVNIEPLDEILPEFLDLHEQLKAFVDAADGLPLDKIKIVSPFNSKIKYSVFSSFHLFLAHERRHLWQAAEVKKTINK